MPDEMASSGVKELERPGRTINGTTTCIIDTDDSTSDEASVGKKTASQKHVIMMTSIFVREDQAAR